MSTSTIDATDATVEALRQRINTLEAEHEEFRRNVRSEVLRQHFDGPWCLPGSQAVLTDLGLPPITIMFDGDAQLTVRITKVDAADYDEARVRVMRALDVACSDSGIEFELDSVDPSLTQRQVRED